MTAKSGAVFPVGGCGDAPGDGNRAASRWASSQSSGSGQLRLAEAARFKYSCTVLTEIEQLRAICRWSSLSSFRSRKTSLILRMDFLLAGNRFSLLAGSTTRLDVQRATCGKRSGASRKVFGFGPEFVFGFTPERCSESARNAVRLQAGMLFGLPRNTHYGLRTVSLRSSGRRRLWLVQGG